MDDTTCREFFSQTKNPYQRRYEALRAVFVEGRSQKEVAEKFGYQYGSLRQLVYEFRQQCRAPDASGESPFFES
jgi:DNA-directed RNA polymerase specialized sigma24 family protein